MTPGLKLYYERIKKTLCTRCGWKNDRYPKRSCSECARVLKIKKEK